MKIATASFAVLLCVGTLFAQQGNFGGRQQVNGAHTDQLKAFLDLSEKQLQDLTDVQKSFRAAASPIMEEIATKAKALRQALRQNPVDSALVTQLKAEIADLRTARQNLAAQYRAQAPNILTPQQKASLASLQQALDLMPAAREATFLNLLDAPQGFLGGPGGPRSPNGRGPGMLGAAVRPKR